MIGPPMAPPNWLRWKGGSTPRWAGEADAMVLEVIERLAVEGVGAGAGGDQDLAGRGDVTGDVLGGAVELELVDGALGDVEDRGADGLVGDVLAVEKDAGGAAGDAGTEMAE